MKRKQKRKNEDIEDLLPANALAKEWGLYLGDDLEGLDDR